MRRLLPPLLAALLAAPSIAQTLYFSDGRAVPMSPSVRIGADSVRIPLDIAGSGSAEITLPLSTLARVDWPRPAELASAEADIKADRPEAALQKLDPLINAQQPLAEIPGAWWGAATFQRALACARLGREIDFMVAIERLRRSPANAALAITAEIAAAGILSETGKATEASALLAKIDRAALPASDLAGLCLVDARLLRAQGRHEDALLVALRVPVLYPAQTASLPAALLLAAESYRSLDETARADAALRALVRRFPDSPEAATALRTLSNNS